MSRRSRDAAPASCHCGDRRPYGDCCGRYHAGEAAPDAEALMRARYCAYVVADEAFLLASWHPTTRPARLDLAAQATKWVGLEVRRHVPTGEDSAIVEFVARCKVRGRADRLHETSRFVREHGRWYYLDGEHPAGGVGG